MGCSLIGQTSLYCFTKAHWDALNTTVVDAGSSPLPTAHFVYVNDNTYVDAFSIAGFEILSNASQLP
jgi:hypothetical protein